MELSGRNRHLSAIPRPSPVISELRTHIAALRVERRFPLARNFEAAVFQAQPADVQIQNRLYSALASPPHFRRRHVGVPIGI